MLTDLVICPQIEYIKKAILSFLGTGTGAGADDSTFESVDDELLKKIFQKFSFYLSIGRISIVVMPEIPNLEYWVESTEIKIDGDYYRNLELSKPLVSELIEIECLESSDLNSDPILVKDMIVQFGIDFSACCIPIGSETYRFVLSLANDVILDDSRWVQANLVTSVYYLLFNTSSIWGEDMNISQPQIDKLSNLFTGRFIVKYCPQLERYDYHKSLSDMYRNTKIKDVDFYVDYLSA